MKFSSFIYEGMSTAASNVSLKKSSISDPNIQKTIKLYASAKSMSVPEAQAKFKAALSKYIRDLGVSKMNSNAVDNAAESVAFQFIQELNPADLDLEDYGIDDPADLLDRDYFFDLTQYVLGENSQFFPLRNPFEKKSVRPYFFITPDHLPLINDARLKQSAKDHCKTAFCTPNAEMVFNRKFSEQLALSALINKPKLTSKKYKSNGGPIPDHYCYLEFVIMHELLHYSSGDHFYTKPMVKRIKNKYPNMGSRADTILNYVGDFINNWQLVKSGYPQLPIGLFSDNVNYDKYETYEEIIDAVVKDMMAVNDDDFNKMKDQMDKSMDEHMDNPDDTPSPGGSESEPSSKDDEQKNAPSNDQSGDDGADNGDQSGDSGDKSGAGGDQSDAGEEDDGEPGGGSGGEPSDGDDGEPSDPNGNASDNAGSPSDGSGDPSDDIASAIDDAFKKNQSRVDNRDDGNNDARKSLDANDDGDVDIKKKVKSGGSKIEFKEGTSVVNWKKLLKKLIPSGDGEVEDTYAKMSRQATSSMVTAAQTGAGRISPGEVKIDAVKRGLVFVIDNSGSVMQQVGQFNTEIINLLKKNKQFLDNMYVIKFSNHFELNKINIAKLKYQEIQNPEALVSGTGKINLGSEHSLIDLFTKSYGAGTEYTAEMHRVIEFLHSKDMNVILFTDADLTRDPRATKFFRLGTKRKNSLAAFITDAVSLKDMENTFGKYPWMTELK